MIVFIDESGDVGFKVSTGSSPYFVVVLILFKEELEAEETALNIKKLRKSLQKDDSFEFKFNKCNRKFREAFLETVKNCNFTIRAIVFNKKTIKSSFLKENKESFYNFALRMLLEHNSGAIKNAKIRLDGSGEKLFRTNLTTYLRKFLNSTTKQVMRNIRFRDSQRDVLIQLADMVAGSIRRYYDRDTKDWDIYRDILKHKEENIWEFK